MRRLFIPFAAASLIAATGASGQEPATPPGISRVEIPLVPLSDRGAAVLPFNRPAGEVIGREIRGRWNARVGEIVEILVRTDGRPVAVAADVSEYARTNRPVVLPLEQIIDQTGYSMVTLSPEQLEVLPRWDP